ncbi:plasmid maintenance protein CcdB (plasmid) [Pseudohalocynthiibacter aestuariivivens]|nr:CcdB family protein [Pseudohalocynthiibacter aestuariivivens]QIE48258.1 plasmid maintenance protein CcdB [Pseudohalocynthiibacter aestuariivivens]
MARFDVYLSPDGPGYLLDVQSDLLEVLNTRMVVPLLPLADAPTPARRLNPVFDLDGAPHVMVTQFMAALPSAAIAAPVGSLSDQSEQITAAIDMLMQGF